MSEEFKESAGILNEILKSSSKPTNGKLTIEKIKEVIEAISKAQQRQNKISVPAAVILSLNDTSFITACESKPDIEVYGGLERIQEIKDRYYKLTKKTL